MKRPEGSRTNTACPNPLPVLPVKFPKTAPELLIPQAKSPAGRREICVVTYGVNDEVLITGVSVSCDESAIGNAAKGRAGSGYVVSTLLPEESIEAALADMHANAILTVRTRPRGSRVSVMLLLSSLEIPLHTRAPENLARRAHPSAATS